MIYCAAWHQLGDVHFLKIENEEGDSNFTVARIWETRHGYVIHTLISHTEQIGTLKEAKKKAVEETQKGCSTLFELLGESNAILGSEVFMHHYVQREPSVSDWHQDEPDMDDTYLCRGCGRADCDSAFEADCIASQQSQEEYDRKYERERRSHSQLMDIAAGYGD